MTRPVLGSVIDTQQSVEQPENSLLATDRPGGGDGDQGQASQEHWRVLPEETGTKAQCGPPDIEIISEEFIVMLRQLSYAIKNQLKAPKAPY